MRKCSRQVSLYLVAILQIQQGFWIRTCSCTCLQYLCLFDILFGCNPYKRRQGMRSVLTNQSLSSVFSTLGRCSKTTIMWSERKRQAGALAQSARCATVPIGQLCQVKALTTSACLKRSDVTKLDNWIEASPTAVHMKPFSTIERVRHLGSTNSCPAADAK